MSHEKFISPVIMGWFFPFPQNEKDYKCCIYFNKPKITPETTKDFTQMAEVSFICKRTVVSTKPVEPRKFSPLSVLDRIMERNYLRLVFYYNFPTRRRAGELTKKLRESISDMLSAFPIVTGRLLKTPDGHWMIKCNDAGLRMVEARVKGTVEEWLKNVDREKELKLVHWEEMFHKPYFWSTFYVQV